MVDSVTYEKVTCEQIDNTKHAIGFGSRKVREAKHRRYEPYRSYFSASPKGSEGWEQFVPIGLVTRNGRHRYHVSGDERLFSGRVTGVEVLSGSDQYTDAIPLKTMMWL